MKVYVITSGEYSDYRIEAIYSTEQKAKEALKVWERIDNGFELEQYELDYVPAVPEGMKPFVVWMRADGSSTVYRSVSDITGAPLWVSAPDFEGNIVLPEPSLNFSIYARDATHAVKIANDHRTKLLAQNQWPTKAGIKSNVIY
jgi:hypothetical protein